MEAHVQELERRLGFSLPTDYRGFLVAHHDSLLDRARLFMPPRKGVIATLLTANDILNADDQRLIGIPEKSVVHIGGNVMGGYLYLNVSKEDFGRIDYMEQYLFREHFPSFAAFLDETQPEISS